MTEPANAMRHPYALAAIVAVALAVPASAQVAPAQVAPAPADRPLRWSAVPVPGSGGRITDVSPSPHDPRRVLILGDMLGVGLSTDGGATWGTAGLGLTGYEMGAATWHPTDPAVVWVGTMSGPAVSRDGGVTFEPRRDGMPAPGDGGYTSPVEVVLFDPADDAHLLAFGGNSRRYRQWATPHPRFGRVWESRDGGATWAALATLTPAGSTPGDAPDGPDNGGPDSDRAGSGDRLNIVGAARLAGGSADLLAAVHGEAPADGPGLYKSTDGGRTWTPSADGLPHNGLHRVVAHPTDPRVAWVAVGSRKPEGADLAEPGGIWKTVDGGATWRPSSAGLSRVADANGSAASRYLALAVSPHDPDRLLTWDAGWSAGVGFVSTDGGDHWEPTMTRRQIEADGAVVVGGERLAPGDGHSVQSYQQTPYGSGAGLETATFDPADPLVAYAAGAVFACRSDDGGHTWTELLSRPAGDGEYGPAWVGTGFNGLVATNIAFDPATPGKWMVQAMDAGRVWLTADGGATWTYHARDPEPWGGGRAGAFAADGRHAYAALGQGTFNGLARTTDGGRTWDVRHGPDHGLPDRGTRGEPGGLAVDPRDPARAFAELNDELWRTDDAGDTWRPVYAAEGLGTVANDPLDPAKLLLGSAAGVLRYDIDGDAGSDASVERLGGPVGAGIAAATDGTVYATGKRGGRDGGLWARDPATGVWTHPFADPQAARVAVDPAHPERLAVTTDDPPFRDRQRASGVWLSDDAGATWAAANDGVAVLRAGPVAFDPHDPTHLVVGLGGRGWLETTWPPGHPLDAAPAGDAATMPPPPADAP